ATIETDIIGFLTPLVPFLVNNPGNPVGWAITETYIRTGVNHAGGTPLPSTFFNQFNGWGSGPVWIYPDAKLDDVIKKAAAAGATEASSGTGVPLSENDTANAVVESVVETARELKAHLKAVMLPRVETHYELVGNAIAERPDRLLGGAVGTQY